MRAPAPSGVVALALAGGLGAALLQGSPAGADQPRALQTVIVQPVAVTPAAAPHAFAALGRVLAPAAVALGRLQQVPAAPLLPVPAAAAPVAMGLPAPTAPAAPAPAPPVPAPAVRAAPAPRSPAPVAPHPNPTGTFYYNGVPYTGVQLPPGLPLLQPPPPAVAAPAGVVDAGSTDMSGLQQSGTVSVSP